MKREFSLATKILVFDFELFIGVRDDLLHNIRGLLAKYGEQAAEHPDFAANSRIMTGKHVKLMARAIEVRCSTLI